VIGLFYLFLLLGLTLLAMDVTGGLRIAPKRARWWRRIGVVAAAGPGLAPMLGWLTGRLAVEWPFPMIALAYLGLFVAFTAGVAGWPGARPDGEAGGLGLRRTAYLGLILLAALPSMVLLVLTPFVAIAGLALARPARERDR
jgi:hypothetical protein